MKKEIAPVVKAICKKYGVRATLAIRNHSTLVLNVKSGNIDFIGQYEGNMHGNKHIQVNRHHYRNCFNGNAVNFLEEALKAMNTGNWNNSRAEIDYFDVGWYVDVNIGKWNEPYEVVA